MGRELELNLQKYDFNELLQCHSKEFSNKHFMKFEDHKKEVSEKEQEVEPPKR
jgi:hypothetical protein